MKDDNIPLNNLNIPPTSSPRFDWLNFLHLITPVALGYVYYKGKQEKAELQDKLNLEIASREEIELNLKEQGIPIFRKELFHKEAAVIIKEEEERAKQTLKKLAKVENCIKHILDIRCSPIKPKVDRERFERYLLELSHTERLEFLDMQSGLKQVFYYDGNHCGGGYENNGQIYRVWMKWWREKVELDKKARIETRKLDLLTKIKGQTILN